MPTWTIDETRTGAEFAVQYMMLSTFKGNFAKVRGFIEFDAETPEDAYVEAYIDVNTVNTNAAERDEQLKGEDFFDALNYPEIAFKSKRVEMADVRLSKVTGDLTIRDTTREVVFDVEYFGALPSENGDKRVGFNGSTRIDREDFGLKWNQKSPTGDVLLGREVTIIIDLQAATAAL